MLKQDTLNLIKNYNFKNMFSICIGKTYINQKRFIEYVGKYNKWDLDISKGKLKLDEKEYDVEIIGTTSQNDNYWYSSEIEKAIPDEYVKIMMDVRKKLETMNFLDLAKPKILLTDEIDDYNLSMIYIAMANENVAYFKGAGNVSIYMYVKNLSDEIFRKMNPNEFSNCILEIISNYDVDHRLMVKALLIENDYEYEEKNNIIIAKFSNDSKLNIVFDEKNRLVKIEGNIS